MASRVELPLGTNLPGHLALIPDGNRRWATERGLHTYEGHKYGLGDVLMATLEDVYDLGIAELSVWLASTENMERSGEEVTYVLEDLYPALVDRLWPFITERGIRVSHFGKKDRLPEVFRGKLGELEEATKYNRKGRLNLCIDYGGQDEIARAFREIVDGSYFMAGITPDLISRHMDTRDSAPLDLVIRTGKERRMSGFMAWFGGYAEIYFEDSLFPDFTPEKLREALLDYSQRARRFGK